MWPIRILALRRFGLVPIDMEVSVQAQDVDAAFQRAIAARVDAFIQLPSTILAREQGHVAKLAFDARLPGVFPSRSFVMVGRLMSYGADNAVLYRRTASYVDRNVDRILRGSLASELPIERPTTFEFAVNSQTARALGITFSADIASQIMAWIE